VKGDQWAYTAGIVAVLLGAVLVYFMFPRLDEEKRLLAEYHTQDTGETAAEATISTKTALEPIS
jgi:MFS transporter, DHA2 family, multidrug resistance protein